MIKYIAVIFFVVSSVNCIDPCTDYIETNDTTLTTSYEPTSDADILCQQFTLFKWFRYTGTDDGLLTDVCPTGRQCGSHLQIWINDTFPDVTDGERPTKVCIHTESSCCSHKNVIKMKNCSDFMVYFSVPTPPCVNYCFQSPTTADSVNGANSVENTNSSNSNSWTLPVVVVVPISSLIICVAVVVFCVWQHKHKGRIGTNEERNNGSNEGDGVQNTRFTSST